LNPAIPYSPKLWTSKPAIPERISFMTKLSVQFIERETRLRKCKIPETQTFLDPLNPKPWDFPQHLGSVSNRNFYSFPRALHKNRKPGKCESGDQYTQNSSQLQST
jgi:hypothetical protein